MEDGELDEEEEGGEQQSKSSVCKYFFKGQCTWGSHCRFMHPGSVDKGSYNMFESKTTTVESGAKPPAPALMVPQPQPRQQQNSQRARSPQVVPPVVPLRLPIPIPAGPPLVDFFPPIPEPPRRETMWERGLRTAKHLAKAAARKRDAIEDKMHGLSEKFDPEYE